MWDTIPSSSGESLWYGQQRRIFEALYTSVQYAYGMQVEGDIIEFGTMTGDTAAVLAEAIAACDRLLAPGYGPIHGAPKTLWLLDSFLGLPEIGMEADRASPHVRAGIWQPASCCGISRGELSARVGRHLGGDRTRIIAGWYKDTVPMIPESSRFACIHIDCDLYASTIDALDPLFARGQVAEGAVILFDDWNCNRASPVHGERLAWEQLVARYHIRSSDEGRYGMAAHRFIVHGYGAASRGKCVESARTDTTELAELRAEVAALRAAMTPPSLGLMVMLRRCSAALRQFRW
jgi:hypothetical protein